MDQPTFGRLDYTRSGLVESDLTPDPMDLFQRWYDDAHRAVAEPNAMVLATAGPRPSARTVLLKGLDGGFVFYTNYESRKAAELADSPSCALLFPWYPLERQVRVEGIAERVPESTSRSYWTSRPRDSQLGAWASVDPVPQSRPVRGRAALESAFAEMERRFAGVDVPLPPTWGGYVVRPETIEFWQGRHGRLHDRLLYRRDGELWITERLAP